MPSAVVPTAAQIARLRRMVAEADDSNGYSDVVLTEAIARYPLIDAEGDEIGDDLWDATSADLNAAASEVWTEKAAARSEHMDFAADGSSFKQQQQYSNAVRMASYYGARRAPGTILIVSDVVDDVADDVEDDE